MDKLNTLLQQRDIIEDYDSTTSPSFNAWVQAVNRELRRLCRTCGGKMLKFSPNHYTWTCFIASQSGQVWYLSCSDVRHFPSQGILFRTAKNNTDYTGGSNQWTPPEELTNTVKKLLKDSEEEVD